MNKLLAGSFALLASISHALACDGGYQCQMQYAIDNVTWQRGLCTRLANNQVRPTDKNGGGYVADPEAFATVTKVCAVEFNIKIGDPEKDLRDWCNKINPRWDHIPTLGVDTTLDDTIDDHRILGITSKYCATKFNINIRQ